MVVFFARLLCFRSMVLGYLEVASPLCSNRLAAPAAVCIPLVVVIGVCPGVPQHPTPSLVPPHSTQPAFFWLFPCKTPPLPSFCPDCAAYLPFCVRLCGAAAQSQAPCTFLRRVVFRGWHGARVEARQHRGYRGSKRANHQVIYLVPTWRRFYIAAHLRVYHAMLSQQAKHRACSRERLIQRCFRPWTTVCSPLEQAR